MAKKASAKLKNCL